MIRTGIVGYGVVGERRRSFIEKNPDFDLIAISDLKFKEKKKEVKGVLYFNDYKDLIQENLDAVFVCLPNNYAPGASILSLNHGKHVFCEKPPGKTLEDIKNVRNAEQNAKSLILKYGFNHRYHDSVMKAFELIQSGDYGSLMNLRGVYGKSAFIPWPRRISENSIGQEKSEWRTSREICGGGILLDQGIHMLDLMIAFAGPFEEIHSFLTNNYWEHDVEDNAYALMKTKSGVVAQLHSSATEWRHRFRLEINLTQGALILGGILSGTRSYGEETLTIVKRNESDNGNPQEQKLTYLEDPSWEREIKEFAECIKNGKAPAVGTSKDALLSMDLVYRIYSADQAWKEKFNI